MGTIERLEALERAATAGPIELIRYPHGGGRAFAKGPRDLVADFYSEGDRELYTAAREALPALLAVAKAAKAYHKLAAGHYDPDRQDEFYRLQADLGEAIERLEAE